MAIAGADLRIDSLFEKAKRLENLTPEEIDEIGMLMELANDEHQVTAIHLIGYIGAEKYLSTLISLIETSRDPLLVSHALIVVARNLDQLRAVRPFVLFALRGLSDEWDDIIGELRLSAMMVAGDVLAKNPDDLEMLYEVVRIFEAQDEDLVLRDEAYRTLLRASGVGQSSLPPASRIVSSTDIDRELVKKIKSRIPRH